MLKEAGSQEAGEPEVGAAEHMIDSLNIEASPLVFRDTLANSNPPESFSRFRWLFQTLDMEQGLRRKWAWQVLEASSASKHCVL